MKRKIIFSVIICFNLLSCSTIKNSEFGCDAINGFRIKTMFGHACAKKYSDAGNVCYDSSQCEGYCFAGNVMQEGVSTVGYCEYHNYSAGKPCFVVENGKSKSHACLEE